VSCTPVVSEVDPSTLSTTVPVSSSESAIGPASSTPATVPRTASAGEGASARACDGRPGGAFADGAEVTLERIGQGSGWELYAAGYPLPGPTEGLWSQWGQGIVSSVDGHHYSALG